MSEVKSLKRNLGTGAVLAASLLLVGNVASATPTTGGVLSSSVSGGVPNVSGITYENFDGPNFVPGIGKDYPYSTTKDGKVKVKLSPDAEVVQGPTNKSGHYAAPYLSHTFPNFGITSIKSGGERDPTKYLTTGSTSGQYSTAHVTLSFQNSERYLGLLWGSVDTYNTLKFYSGAYGTGNNLATFTGSDVNALANGNQLATGTSYVNINLDAPFKSAVATSSSYAFEFDNVAFKDTPVPEPDSLGLLALGLTLLGFGVWKRKSNQRNLIE